MLNFYEKVIHAYVNKRVTCFEKVLLVEALRCIFALL